MSIKLRLSLLFIISINVMLSGKIFAQPCPPVVNQIADTICSGDSAYGYSETGVYADTFMLDNGCDSIRIVSLTVIPATGTAPSPLTFNTGTNGVGGALPGGSNDLHWEIATDSINATYSPAIVMTNTSAYYNSPWPDCQWISHSAMGDHIGIMDFYYKMEFNLPCSDLCGSNFSDNGTFCLNLDFFADNAVDEIYINGMPQSPNLGGVIPVSNPYTYIGYQMAGITTVSLCNDWHPGANTIIVKISSGQPLEGFLAQASVILPPPPPPLSADFSIGAGAIAGGSDTGCAPYEVQFINNSVNATNYTWDFGDGSTNSNAVNPSHTYMDTGTYSVILYAHNNTACNKDDTAYMTIVVLKTDTPDIATRDTLICNREQAVTIHVLVNNPTTHNVFLWQPLTGILGANNQDSITIAPVQNTTYYVTVWDTIPGLCGYSKTDTVHISYEPRSLDILNDDTTLCQAAEVSVTVEGSPGYSYKWSPSIGIVAPTDQNPIIMADHSMTYTVTASYPGCADTSQSIRIDLDSFCDCFFNIPTAFSPNGDGMNDIFLPVIEAGCPVDHYSLNIYNRYGENIFRSADPAKGWNGTYNGGKVDVGVYFFEVNFIGGTKGNKYYQKGDVTLLR